MAQLQQQVTGEQTPVEWRSEAPPVAGGVAVASPVTPNREVPATARHVRPDEVLAAIAAVEARKGKAVVGTVPIGEVLERLQAGDVEADEIWQEIVARRVQNRKANTMADFEARRRRRRWVQGGVGVAALFATAFSLRLLAGDMKKVDTPQSAPATTGLNGELQPPSLPQMPPATRVAPQRTATQPAGVYTSQPTTVNTTTAPVNLMPPRTTGVTAPGMAAAYFPDVKPGRVRKVNVAPGNGPSAVPPGHDMYMIDSELRHAGNGNYIEVPLPQPRIEFRRRPDAPPN